LGQSQMRLVSPRNQNGIFLSDKPEESIKQRGPGGKERERERGERERERDREKRERRGGRGKKRRSNWASLRCAHPHQGTRMAFFD
jgi:hypothetical protein